MVADFTRCLREAGKMTTTSTRVHSELVNRAGRKHQAPNTLSGLKLEGIDTSLNCCWKEQIDLLRLSRMTKTAEPNTEVTYKSYMSLRMFRNVYKCAGY